MTASSFASITCSTCATTSTVPIDALLISVTDDDTDTDAPPANEGTTPGAGPAGTVTWTCQPCADLTTTEITWSMLLALVTAGATLLDETDESGQSDELELPEHPEHPADGADLTPDDLLALHELLATDTWFAQLSATTGAQQ